METFKRLLVITATFFTGMLISSMWITNSDSWKIYLPVVLLCITLKMTLDKNELK
tara:strand:- start:1353 stop:1517 length:165 start_codon:yes stop_codon:yes gene_type:complete